MVFQNCLSRRFREADYRCENISDRLNKLYALQLLHVGALSLFTCSTAPSLPDLGGGPASCLSLRLRAATSAYLPRDEKVSRRRTHQGHSSMAKFPTIWQPQIVFCCLFTLFFIVVGSSKDLFWLIPYLSVSEKAPFIVFASYLRLWVIQGQSATASPIDLPLLQIVCSNRYPHILNNLPPPAE